MLIETEPQVEDDIHVSSPPNSIIDSDTSLMSDIDEDKDVFRTKVLISVCISIYL